MKPLKKPNESANSRKTLTNIENVRQPQAVAKEDRKASFLPLVNAMIRAHDARMKRLLNALYSAGLALNARLTRSALKPLEQRVFTPSFIALTQLIRGRRRIAPDAALLGREWERLLGARRAAHVTHVDESTAYGEITVECPLRGTGDVHACHRLMAYDRGLLDAAGGQLVVLESQASPGRTRCVVAIRPKGASLEGLAAAHLRSDT